MTDQKGLPRCVRTDIFGVCLPAVKPLRTPHSVSRSHHGKRHNIWRSKHGDLARPPLSPDTDTNDRERPAYEEGEGPPRDEDDKDKGDGKQTKYEEGAGGPEDTSPEPIELKAMEAPPETQRVKRVRKFDEDPSLEEFDDDMMDEKHLIIAADYLQGDGPPPAPRAKKATPVRARKPGPADSIPHYTPDQERSIAEATAAHDAAVKARDAYNEHLTGYDEVELPALYTHAIPGTQKAFRQKRSRDVAKTERLNAAVTAAENALTTARQNTMPATDEGAVETKSNEPIDFDGADRILEELNSQYSSVDSLKARLDYAQKYLDDNTGGRFKINAEASSAEHGILVATHTETNQTYAAQPGSRVNLTKGAAQDWGDNFAAFKGYDRVGELAKHVKDKLMPAAGDNPVLKGLHKVVDKKITEANEMANEHYKTRRKAKIDHAVDKGFFDPESNNYVNRFVGASKGANDSINLLSDAHLRGALPEGPRADARVYNMMTTQDIFNKEGDFHNVAHPKKGGINVHGVRTEGDVATAGLALRKAQQMFSRSKEVLKKWRDKPGKMGKDAVNKLKEYAKEQLPKQLPKNREQIREIIKNLEKSRAQMAEQLDKVKDPETRAALAEELKTNVAESWENLKKEGLRDVNSIFEEPLNFRMDTVRGKGGPINRHMNMAESSEERKLNRERWIEGRLTNENELHHNMIDAMDRGASFGDYMKEQGHITLPPESVGFHAQLWQETHARKYPDARLDGETKVAEPRSPFTPAERDAIHRTNPKAFGSHNADYLEANPTVENQSVDHFRHNREDPGSLFSVKDESQRRAWYEMGPARREEILKKQKDNLKETDVRLGKERERLNAPSTRAELFRDHLAAALNPVGIGVGMVAGHYATKATDLLLDKQDPTLGSKDANWEDAGRLAGRDALSGAISVPIGKSFMSGLGATGKKAADKFGVDLAEKVAPPQNPFTFTSAESAHLQKYHPELWEEMHEGEQVLEMAEEKTAAGAAEDAALNVGEALVETEATGLSAAAKSFATGLLPEMAGAAVGAAAQSASQYGTDKFLKQSLKASDETALGVSELVGGIVGGGTTVAATAAAGSLLGAIGLGAYTGGASLAGLGIAGVGAGAALGAAFAAMGYAHHRGDVVLQKRRDKHKRELQRRYQKSFEMAQAFQDRGGSFGRTYTASFGHTAYRPAARVPGRQASVATPFFSPTGQSFAEKELARLMLDNQFNQNLFEFSDENGHWRAIGYRQRVQTNEDKKSDNFGKYQYSYDEVLYRDENGKEVWQQVHGGAGSPGQSDAEPYVQEENPSIGDIFNRGTNDMIKGVEEMPAAAGNIIDQFNPFSDVEFDPFGEKAKARKDAYNLKQEEELDARLKMYHDEEAEWSAPGYEYVDRGGHTGHDDRERVYHEVVQARAARDQARDQARARGAYVDLGGYTAYDERERAYYADLAKAEASTPDAPQFASNPDGPYASQRISNTTTSSPESDTLTFTNDQFDKMTDYTNHDNDFLTGDFTDAQSGSVTGNLPVYTDLAAG